jgi:hypothetical protein
MTTFEQQWTTSFRSHIYHSIVCIGAVIAHHDGDHWLVDSLGAPDVGERSEKELISHADTGAAKRGHGRLEGFHIDKDLVGLCTSAGPIPETLQPIFRDRHELDAGGPLAEQTIAALDGLAALLQSWR